MEGKIVCAVVGIVILCILAYILTMAGTQEKAPIETTTQPGDTSPKALSDIQVEACNAADESGTCYTRLQELGIATPEECCQSLGKCCV